MNKEKKIAAYLFSILAIVLAIGYIYWVATGRNTTSNGIILLGIAIFGIIMLIFGSVMYAKGKGYRATMAVYGPIFILMLPDKRKEQQSKTDTK